MICILTHRAVHGVIATVKNEKTRATKLDCDLPRAISATPSASLDRTCQLFSAPLLDNNEFPSFVKNFLDLCRDVDDLAGGYDLVVPVDITIKHFFVPKTVFRFSVLVDVSDIISM